MQRLPRGSRAASRRPSASASPAYNALVDCTRIRNDLLQFFAEPRPGVAAAWLFGSVARGTARAGSDVDVAILTGTTPADLQDLRLDLEAEIERMLRVPTQVVLIDAAPVDLSQRVMRDGILLAEHDRSARIRFEVRVRNEFWDLLPYLEEYRRVRRPA